MRKSLTVFAAAAGTAAVALLCACSSGESQGPTSGLPNSGASQGHMRSDVSRSGILSEFHGVAPTFPEHSARVSPDKKKKAKDLFVSDWGTGAVEILKNKSWQNIGSITDGMDGPEGTWVDSKGNLYVANYEGIDITEYAKGTSSPTYTYNSGMDDPIGVTTDRQDNVYESDWQGGYVSEYAQGSNTQIKKCSPGGVVEGVAVDSKGDVFVAYYTYTDYEGRIAEYKGGLSGCSGTALGATVEYPGGMVLDKSNNLVICDQAAETVDVIKPPYNSISGTLGSGYSNPFGVTVNKKNNQAYVVNTSLTAGYVLVLSYPGGSTEDTLGSSNGLEEPISAVDSENHVP